MIVLHSPGQFIYIADSGDWRLEVGPGRFAILPQVGGLEYQSGFNLDTLAALIAEAKAHAIAAGINWGGA